MSESFKGQIRARYNSILTFKLMIGLAVKIQCETYDFYSIGTYTGAREK